MFGMNFGKESKMLGFIHIPEVCSHPNKSLYKYQERIENVWFYAHPRNMFPTPKCLAQISGENSKFCFFYTS